MQNPIWQRHVQTRVTKGKWATDRLYLTWLCLLACWTISNWALIGLHDTAGSLHHRSLCTEHGFCYGCLQEGCLLYLRDWMVGWSWKGNWRTFRRIFIVTAFARWRTQYQGFIIRRRYLICVAGQRRRRVGGHNYRIDLTVRMGLDFRCCRIPHYIKVVKIWKGRTDLLMQACLQYS